MARFFRSIAGLTSAVPPAAFIASVIHDEGYFSVVGKKFQGIASLTDYLTGVLDWLPAVAAGAGAFGLVQTLILTVSLKTLQRGVPSAPDPKTPAGKRFGLLTGLANVVLWGVCGFWFYFFGSLSDIWLLALYFFLFWVGLVVAALSNADPKQTLGPTAIALLVLAPPLVVATYAWGLQRGYNDMRDGGERYRLLRTMEGKDEGWRTLDVKVLRVFQSGVLIRVPDQGMNDFVRWDQVRSLQVARPTPPSESLGCRQLGLFCGR